MSGPFYDRRGRRISVDEWGRLHEGAGYRLVSLHVFRGWRVSTVWTGFDPRPVPSAEPARIFETAIFAPGGTLHEAWRARYRDSYATEDAARAGHDRALAALRENMRCLDETLAAGQ